MSTSFKDYLDEQLQSSTFKDEYDALEIEFIIIQAIIDARKHSELTQNNLSKS